MQAWFARRYGGLDVLRLEELEIPVAGAGEVLVRVEATTVNSGDVRVRGCDFPKGMKTMGRLALGWTRPRQPILGTEFSGVVEAVGTGVRSFSPGDRVFAFPGGRMGAHAQFVAMPETGRIALLPRGLDFGAGAALCFGGTTALHFLRAAKLRAGQSVLVLGGSGAVGLAFVQIAREQGAEVTATTSTRNLALVTEHGAHAVIDYTTMPVTGRFDIVADTVGVMTFRTAQALLRSGGRYIAISGVLAEMLGSLLPGPQGTRSIAGPAGERREDLAELARLAEAGQYRAHIDRVYPWAEMTAAHAYVETGRKRGSVVVRVAE